MGRNNKKKKQDKKLVSQEPDPELGPLDDDWIVWLETWKDDVARLVSGLVACVQVEGGLARQDASRRVCWSDELDDDAHLAQDMAIGCPGVSCSSLDSEMCGLPVVHGGGDDSSLAAPSRHKCSSSDSGDVEAASSCSLSDILHDMKSCLISYLGYLLASRDLVTFADVVKSAPHSLLNDLHGLIIQQCCYELFWKSRRNMQRHKMTRAELSRSEFELMFLMNEESAMSWQSVVVGWPEVPRARFFDLVNEIALSLCKCDLMR
eukprot:TRINITY_DN20287_c0_g4_i1.p1 TRINITY_DN20287_c0_g4~~TRINITY_DN20287_c0_g4_i1.p1  ORF type:complete len:263 (-),score=36.96 TRINITY_DN20287_c0_g4_i1:84-872(-)